MRIYTYTQLSEPRLARNGTTCRTRVHAAPVYLKTVVKPVVRMLKDSSTAVEDNIQNACACCTSVFVPGTAL